MNMLDTRTVTDADESARELMLTTQQDGPVVTAAGYKMQKRKVSGAATYRSKFRRNYSKKVAMHRACTTGIFKLFCTIGTCTLRYAHMAEGDIRQHVTGKRQIENGRTNKLLIN